MGILAVAVMVTSIVAFGYGIEMGGGYKGTYADVYGGYYAGLEDGYTIAFLDIIVYNQSIDTAVNLGIVSSDNVNLDYYRKVWIKYVEEENK